MFSFFFKSIVLQHILNADKPRSCPSVTCLLAAVLSDNILRRVRSERNELK